MNTIYPLLHRGKKTLSMVAVLILLSSGITVSAADLWSGEGDAGFNKSTGNTKNTSLLARLALSYEKERWAHAIKLGATGSSEGGQNTAESYTAKWKSKFNISALYYGFGSTRYEKDRFSGYAFQSTTAAGLGARLLETESASFDIEGGIGYRFSETQDTKKSRNEATLLGGAVYQQQLTETTQFNAEANIEAGNDNVYTESVLALKVKINTSLALKLSYLLKHNSDTAPGTKKTDTLSSITLNYSF